MAAGRLLEPDLGLIREVKKAGGDSLKKCYQCATCSVVCELSPENRPFPRKEMILSQWGQTEQLMSDPDLWLCHQCNDCSTNCPRGARPGDVLAAIRTYIYKHYAFPRFMGSALATPKALPLLLLVPMIAIFAMMMTFSADFGFMSGPVEFQNMIPHGWIEGLFISGNALIFLFALIGLARFYRGLQTADPNHQGPGFLSSLFMTAVEVFTHRNFNSCKTNKARFIAHMLVLFGFIGAMITAGLALIAMVGFEFGPPIPLSHPIKWLGNASAIAGLVGTGILIVRRLTNRDRVGANGYSDWLFLIMLFLVFLTGWLTQFGRLAESAYFAYSIYYVHLVLVFFVLWYMPYSKFAHMLYRAMALVYARSVGRTVGMRAAA